MRERLSRKRIPIRAGHDAERSRGSAGVRVILADDGLLFREGTARILTEAGFGVAGQARDAAELLDLVRRDPPEVAIIDIRMPPGHSSEGVEAAVAIRRMCPRCRPPSARTARRDPLRHPVDDGIPRSVGYLLKDRVCDLATFAADVRRVAKGDCVIDPELVARLVARKREGDPLEVLTERERKVLALMAQGLSTSALSVEPCLSAKTVEAHIRSIFTS